jgi:hypothetical protein
MVGNGLNPAIKKSTPIIGRARRSMEIDFGEGKQ